MRTMESIYEKVSLYGERLVDIQGKSDRFLAYQYKGKFYYFELDKGELTSSTVFKSKPNTLDFYLNSNDNKLKN